MFAVVVALRKSAHHKCPDFFWLLQLHNNIAFFLECNIDITIVAANIMRLAAGSLVLRQIAVSLFDIGSDVEQPPPNVDVKSHLRLRRGIPHRPGEALQKIGVRRSVFLPACPERLYTVGHI